MAELKKEHKTLIVTRLACYATPSDIRNDLKAEFKVDATLSQICFYNPLSAQGCRELPEEWQTLFVTTREAFQKQLAAVPIADQFYRLYRLQQLIDDELLSKSPKTVMKALEQAAKEMGGLFTKPEERQDSGDPNAISQSLEDAVEKIYGAPQPSEQDTDGSVAAVGQPSPAAHAQAG